MLWATKEKREALAALFLLFYSYIDIKERGCMTLYRAPRDRFGNDRMWGIYLFEDVARKRVRGL